METLSSIAKNIVLLATVAIIFINIIHFCTRAGFSDVRPDAMKIGTIGVIIGILCMMLASALLHNGSVWFVLAVMLFIIAPWEQQRRTFVKDNQNRSRYVAPNIGWKDLIFPAISIASAIIALIALALNN